MRETEVECGQRTILNTDHQVACLISKTGTGRRPWLLTFGVCNGIAEGGVWCPTRGEALALADSYRAGEPEWSHDLEAATVGYGGGQGRCKRAV